MHSAYEEVVVLITNSVAENLKMGEFLSVSHFFFLVLYMLYRRGERVSSFFAADAA